VGDEKLSAAKERAWVQRDRLNDLADYLEEQLDRNAQPLHPWQADTWIDALKAIAQDQDKTEAFLLGLRRLFQHVRRCYPLEL
jgi:hypothetical protein